MSLFQLILAAIIQGITEFLPISSSGHLILLPSLTGLDDQGLAIDVAVHVGTLGAVVLYFWSEVKQAASGLPRALTGHTDSAEARLAMGLIIATIPTIIVGAILGPHGLKLVSDPELLSEIGTIGIIFLLFLVGLDLPPAKLKNMAGKGALAAALTTVVFFAIGYGVMLAFGFSNTEALITGIAAILAVMARDLWSFWRVTVTAVLAIAGLGAIWEPLPRPGTGRPL